MRVLTVLALLSLVPLGCSGSQQAKTPPPSAPVLDIDQPASGSLSDSQLATIAADIQRLEKHPLADGAQKGRSNLFKWIQGSPDVSVTLCKGIIGPLVESDSRHQSKLLNQFILSSAAYKIENPNADPVAVNVGGLQGALQAYQSIAKYQGDDAEDEFMESIAKRSEDGQLKRYVRSGLQEC